uniref:Putative 5'-nucleotidase/apyrase n=1 Tax=Ixodes ricinus TaxID=34613 RepID=A0A6B0U559_IXORI
MPCLLLTTSTKNVLRFHYSPVVFFFSGYGLVSVMFPWIVIRPSIGVLIGDICWMYSTRTSKSTGPDSPYFSALANPSPPLATKSVVTIVYISSGSTSL